jgi:hypothetical protein
MPLPASPSFMSTPTPDYPAIIRDQISREVENLKRRFKANHGMSPAYVELGKMVALHHGHLVLDPNEPIGGLPVVIGQGRFHSISVRANGVEKSEEYEELDPDCETGDEYVTRVRYWTEDLVETADW